MWPFRRNRGTDQVQAPEPAATGPVHRGGPAAWRSAPPLAVIQTSRTTIDRGFVSHLATRADPSFLAPLGHHVVPEAPAGAVHGLAVPDAGPRTFAQPPGAHATTQRVVAGASAATGTPTATPDTTAVAAPTTLAPVATPLVTPQRTLVDASTVAIPPVPARATVQLRPLDDAAAAPVPETLPVDAAPPATIAHDPPTSGETPSTSPTIGAEAATPVAAPSPTPTPTASPTPATPPVVSRATDPATPTGRPRPRIGAPIERPAPAGADAAITAPLRVQRHIDLPPAGPIPFERRTDTTPEPDAAGLVGTTPLAPAAPLVGPGGDAPDSSAVVAAVPSVQTATTASTPAIRSTSAATSTPVPTTADTSTTPSGAPSPRAAAPSSSASAPPGTSQTVARIGAPVQRRIDQPSFAPTLGNEPPGASALGIEPRGTSALRIEPPGASALRGAPPGASPLDASATSAPHGAGPRATPTAAPVTATADSRPAAGPTAASPPAAWPTTVMRELVGSTTSPVATTTTDPSSPRPARTSVPLPADAVPQTVQLAPLLGERAVATAWRGDRLTDGLTDAVPARATTPPAATPPAAAPPMTSPVAPSTITPRPVTPSPPTVVSRSAAMPPEVSRLVAAASAAPLTSGPPPEPSPAPAPPVESYVPPWVQRTEEPTTGGTSVGAPAAITDATPAAAGTADTGDASARTPSAAEIDQLARALYPQLRRRLGRDLLLDRERLGYRTDIRF